jgi:hypothetical protein
MEVVRYAGVDQAAGSWGMFVQARAGHLRTDIQDSNRNSLWVEYADLLWFGDRRTHKKITDVVRCDDNWSNALWNKL